MNIIEKVTLGVIALNVIVFAYLYYLGKRKETTETEQAPGLVQQIIERFKPSATRPRFKHNNRRRTPGRIIQEIKLSANKSRFIHHK
jgi:hypothetical protein